MQTELIYDAFTMSTAPSSTLKFGGAILTAALLWATWLKYSGYSLHAGVKMLGIMGVVLLVISVLSVYELEIQPKRFTVQTVEGPVIGKWNKRERTRNHRSASSTAYDTTDWEGFQVGGVAFVYALNVEQNWFHNAGSTANGIEDGNWLRVSYFQEGEGGQLRITRVERITRNN